jgi:hypothetical protein
MSSTLAIEEARQRLVGERHQSPSRVLGYANRLILRVEHRRRNPPDDIIHEIDPRARLLQKPPIEEGFTLDRGEKQTAEELPRSNDAGAAADVTGTREHYEGDAAPGDVSTPGAVS